MQPLDMDGVVAIGDEVQAGMHHLASFHQLCKVPIQSAMHDGDPMSLHHEL